MPSRPQGLPHRTIRHRIIRTSAVRRVSASVLGILALLTLATACLPADLRVVLVQPATSGKVQGDGPLGSMWTASKANASCGLTAAQLTAMVLVPTFFESGGTSPSPMTLSRWDNVSTWSLNANLFPFARTSGAYTGAFFSPGIGLWQFDSAGGWNLTAASAIDTDTAAATAASMLAYRWCNAPTDRLNDPVRRRAYAWGAWYYCTTSTRCEDAYNAVLVNDKLDLGTDSSIDRLGGMEQRVCDVVGLGTGLTCHYIDPGRAQGSRSWTYGTYDPARPDYVTPLPKPFYDIEANGREYRIWVRDDTGFDIGITASKPVTANARSTGTLIWTATSNLCDVTAHRGDCAKARVAQTPWGPRSEDPIGFLESATVSKLNRATVTGWTLDPDVSTSITVHVFVDGAYRTQGVADGTRTDLETTVPGYGSAHGYSISVDLTGGSHDLCVFAINVAPFGTANPLLGCQTVVVPGDPIGGVDPALPIAGGVQVKGWALDADTTGPLDVHLYADGRFVTLAHADLARPELATSYPAMGTAHGFDGYVHLMAGTHRVCAYAINAPSTGTTNTELGCQSVSVSGQSLGSLDLVAPAPGGFRISGWALDPETGDASVAVTIDGAPARTIRSGVDRPDVGLVYPQFGPKHGFSAVVTATGGSHQVCATVINQGVGGADLPLGCRSVTVPSGPPIGNLEYAGRGWGGLVVAGWALDPDTAGPVTIHAYVNGVFAKAFVADATRPDVGSVYPGYGDRHGFTAYFPIPSVGSTVCLYVINRGPWTPNTTLSCRVY